jgi:DNA-binding MarR family transcriptional regulator
MPKELLASTLFLLARAGSAIKARTLDELEEAGFGMYQYSVLALLGEGDRPTQRLIASELGLDRSQLVGVLDGLEERGLIVRRRDPDDRRRHTVSLTPEGKRQLVRIRSIITRLEDSVLKALDGESRKPLHAALERIAVDNDWCSPAR